MKYTTISETINSYEHIVCYEDTNGIENLDDLYDYEYNEGGNVILYFEDSKEEAIKRMEEIIKFQKSLMQHYQ